LALGSGVGTRQPWVLPFTAVLASLNRGNSLNGIFTSSYSTQDPCPMADEKFSAPSSSRTPGLEAGGPQISSTMSANAHNDKLPPPGEVEETPIASSSATYASATTPRLPTRFHLQGFLRVKVGAGILRDIRARAPWYWSDWKDAWNYRVLPATALVFFAK
jgi:hypothetical protein